MNARMVATAACIVTVLASVPVQAAKLASLSTHAAPVVLQKDHLPDQFLTLFASGAKSNGTPPSFAIDPRLLPPFEESSFLMFEEVALVGRAMQLEKDPNVGGSPAALLAAAGSIPAYPRLSPASEPSLAGALIIPQLPHHGHPHQVDEAGRMSEQLASQPAQTAVWLLAAVLIALLTVARRRDAGGW
jgi:hypothetical protein